MEFCFSIFWCRLGDSEESCGASFWVVELVQEDLFESVELDYLLLVVDLMAGEEQLHF